MATRGARTRTTVKTATPVITRSVRRRRRLIGGTVVLPEGKAMLDISPRGLAPGNSPHQQLRHRIHDYGDQEERQANLNQRGKIDVPGSFAELVGQYAGHGVAGRE